MFCYVFYPTVFENCHKVTGQSLIFIPNNKCLVNIRKRMVNLCILGYWLQQPCAGQMDYLATSFSIGEILPCEKEWINSSRLSELKKISFYHFPFSMGSQRVWHDLATEQQQQPTFPVTKFQLSGAALRFWNCFSCLFSHLSQEVLAQRWYCALD